MKVSIITVSFNSAGTIRETIKSVLSQNYPNVEYIIVDGESTDGTLDIVREFGSAISKVVSERDNGIYDAMNKGIGLCTGEVIGILNSDDLYEDTKVISTVMEAFRADSLLQMVYGDIVYVRSDDTRLVVRKWISKGYYPRFFEHGHVPPHPSLFVKKEVYQKAGLFKPELRLAADYEFMLRAFKVHQFKARYIHRLSVRMRLGGATNKNVKNIINGNREILTAWKMNQLKIPYLLMPKRIFLRVIQFVK